MFLINKSLPKLNAPLRSAILLLVGFSSRQYNQAVNVRTTTLCWTRGCATRPLLRRYVLRGSFLMKNLVAAFLFFTLFVSHATHAQVTWVIKTGRTATFISGDDGDTQRGISMLLGRLKDNADGTVTDRLTGLIWLKDAECMQSEYPSTFYWPELLIFANELKEGMCGLMDDSNQGDWRMPTINELISLSDAGNARGIYDGYDAPFVDIWFPASSTSINWTPSSRAWEFLFSSGNLDQAGKTSNHDSWAVKKERVPAIAPVPKTGQVVSYHSYDDGAFQSGVSMPNPRFSDNGDGSATDNLTGLIWLKNANCFGAMLTPDAFNVVGNLADGQCGLSDGSTSGDWYIPNKNEMFSLLNFGYSQPMISSADGLSQWTDGDLFVNVQSAKYMTSTLDRNSGTWHFRISVGGGLSSNAANNTTAYVWPIKGKDSDGDGIVDYLDAFPAKSAEWLDSDLDGVGNNADWDDDNDGIPDAVDLNRYDSNNSNEMVLPLNADYKGGIINKNLQ